MYSASLYVSHVSAPATRIRIHTPTIPLCRCTSLHCHGLAEASAGGRSPVRCLIRIHYITHKEPPSLLGVCYHGLLARRCTPPASAFISNPYPILFPTLILNSTELTYSPSCSLAISPAQRTSRSGSTSARKPTLVHQAEMTPTWALSRLCPNLPISLSWLVLFLCTYAPEGYNPCCRTSMTSGSTSLVGPARSRSLSPTDPRRYAYSHPHSTTLQWQPPNLCAASLL